MASNNPSKVFVALKKFRGESRHQPTNSAETDAAAQMLHRIRVEQGPAQWHAEAARLHALFQSTRDPKQTRKNDTRSKGLAREPSFQ